MSKRQFKNYVLVVSALLVCLSAVPGAQADESDNTLLWRVSGNGLTSDSYLYGTFHVQDERVFRFNDSVATAFYACEALATEVHFDSASSQMVDYFTGNEINPGVSLDEALPKLDADKLVETLVELTGMQPDAVRSASLRSLLYSLQMGSFEQDRTVVIDTYLYAHARQSDKEIYGLETMAEQLKFLMAPATKQDWIDLANEIQIYSDADELLDEMIGYYREGDLTGLMDFSLKMQTSQDLEEDYGLVERNYIMVERAQAIMRRKSLFIAVGALHLPGEEGVISLLRKEGFTVEPVVAAHAGLGRQFDELNLDFEWETYSDSLNGLRMQSPSEPVAGPPIDLGEVPYDLSVVYCLDIVQQRTYMVMALDLSGVIGSEGVAPAALDDMYRGMINGMSERFRNDTGGEELTIEDIQISGKRAVRATAQAENLVEIRAVLNKSSLIMLMAFAQGSKAQFSDFDRFFAGIELFEPQKPVKTDSPEELPEEIELVGEVYMLRPTDSYFKVAVPSAVAPVQLNTEGVQSYLAKSVKGAVTFLVANAEAGANKYYVNDVETLNLMTAKMLLQLKATADDKRYVKTATTSEVYVNFSAADSSKGEMRVVMQGSRAVTLLAFGNGLEDERQDVDAFMESLSFENAKDLEWGREENAQFGYSAEVPGDVYEIKASTATMDLSAMYSSGFLGVAPDTRYDYMALVVEHGPYARELSDTSYAYHYSLRKVNEIGDSVISIRPVKIDGFEGYETFAVSRTGALGMRSRAFLRGQNVLFFMVRQFKSDLESPESERFFNSISIEPYSGVSFSDSKTRKLLTDMLSADAAVAAPAIKSLPYYRFAADEFNILFDAIIRGAMDPNERTASILPALVKESFYFDSPEIPAKLEKSFTALKDFPEARVAVLNVLLRDPAATADKAMTRILQSDLSSLAAYADAIFEPRTFYNPDVFKADWKSLQPLLKQHDLRMEMYTYADHAIRDEVATAADVSDLMQFAAEDVKTLLAAAPRKFKFDDIARRENSLISMLNILHSSSSAELATVRDILCASQNPQAASCIVYFSAIRTGLEFCEHAINVAAQDPKLRLQFLNINDPVNPVPLPEKWRTQPMVAEGVLVTSLEKHFEVSDIQNVQQQGTFEVKYGEKAGRYYVYSFEIPDGTILRPGVYAGMAGPQPLNIDDVSLFRDFAVTSYELWDTATAREHFDSMFASYYEE